MKKSDIVQRRERFLVLIATLPEATATACGERHRSLEVRGKRFGWLLEDHHGDERLALNCKATRGESQSLAAANPLRFHIPKYLGHHGWLGLWLDLPQIDWAEVAQVLRAAYCLTAPKRLAAQCTDQLETLVANL